MVPGRAALRYGMPLLALCAVGPSCSPDGSEAEEAGYHEPGPICYEVVRNCHYADYGEPGEVHDCHALGHEGTEPGCAAQRDRCIDVCAKRRLELGIDIHGKPLVDAGADARTDAGSGGDGASADSGHVVQDARPVTKDAPLGGLQQCIRLGSVCHKVDPGSGPIHDCHGIGHAEEIPECEANYSRCIALCTGT
jgi:hypothetical protein